MDWGGVEVDDSVLEWDAVGLPYIVYYEIETIEVLRWMSNEFTKLG